MKVFHFHDEAALLKSVDQEIETRIIEPDFQSVAVRSAYAPYWACCNNLTGQPEYSGQPQLANDSLAHRNDSHKHSHIFHPLCVPDEFLLNVNYRQLFNKVRGLRQN